jgi:hypothetical protein
VMIGMAVIVWLNGQKLALAVNELELLKKINRIGTD